MDFCAKGREEPKPIGTEKKLAARLKSERPESQVLDNPDRTRERDGMGREKKSKRAR